MAKSSNDSISVSVIISTYNHESYIADAIKSVLNQTRQPDEIIVADDDSTDGTKEIIREYQDLYPDLVSLEISSKNRGIAENANSGFSAATGDIVTLLAGDDRFRQTKLETELKYLKDGGTNAVISDHYIISEVGEKINRITYTDCNPQTDTFIKTFARDVSFRICTHTAELHEELNGFSEIELYTDWDFMIRLTHEGNIKYISEPLDEYRQHDRSVSAAVGTQTQLTHVNRVYHKNAPLLNQYSTAKSDYVRTSLFLYNLKQEADEYLRQGNQIASIKKYLQWMVLNPERTDEVQLAHLRYFLPSKLFNVLQRCYRRF